MTRPRHVEIDSYHVHEVMHVAELLSEVIERQLADHPAVLQNQTLLEYANDASAALIRLYTAAACTYSEIYDPPKGATHP